MHRYSSLLLVAKRLRAVLFVVGLLVLVLADPTAHAWTVPLPGGGRIAYEGGLLRIRTSTGDDLPPMPDADATIDPSVLAGLVVRDTHTAKGFGVYWQESDGKGDRTAHNYAMAALPKHTFLGFYEGVVRTTLQGLSNTEYLMSLDGGATYLDGYKRAQDRSTFSPVHLNHADPPSCNCLRVLDKGRCAFFTARDIGPGEELTFNYGANFWRGREQEKI